MNLSPLQRDLLIIACSKLITPRAFSGLKLQRRHDYRYEEVKRLSQPILVSYIAKRTPLYMYLLMKSRQLFRTLNPLTQGVLN